MSRRTTGFFITSSMVLIASLGASPALAQQAIKEAPAAQPFASAQETSASGNGWLKSNAEWIETRFGRGVDDHYSLRALNHLPAAHVEPDRAPITSITRRADLPRWPPT